ncbi:hypothetical protein ACFL5D_04410, partial [Candidatus Neomarinimicrobiota bacterium]
PFWPFLLPRYQQNREVNRNIYIIEGMLGRISLNLTKIYLQFSKGYIKEVLADWLPQAIGKLIMKL